MRPVTAPARVERVYTPRILAVFGATMLYFGVAGVAFPVLPRLVERELGGGSAEIGLAFGVWAIGMLVVRPFGGYMLDRIGRRPVMIGGALALVVAQLLHTPAAGTGELWVLLVVRVFSGAASSVMYLSQATVATELPPAEHRDRVFGLFSTVVLVGFAVGQVFGEIVMQAHGFAWAFALAAAFCGSTAVVACVLPETRPPDAVPAANVRDLFHPVAARVGVVNMLVFVGFLGFNAFIADYGEEFGIEDARWLLLTYSVVVMGMRSVSGLAFVRFPRRWLATFAHGTVIIGALLLATASSTAWLYAAAVVLAIGLAWNVPLMILIAVDSASDAERSRAVATVTTFGDLANALGTLALGFVADAFGYEGMYVVVAGSALAALVLMRSPFLAHAPGVAGRRSPQLR